MSEVTSIIDINAFYVFWVLLNTAIIVVLGVLAYKLLKKFKNKKAP